MELLACPDCGGDLTLNTEKASDDGEIAAGLLTCQACSHTYPIQRGVPRLLPKSISSVEDKTASAFGWEWQEFTEMHPEYESQFLDWIYPLQPAFFRGKAVLDAGCGIGRHAYHAARYGAKEVVAMDLSAAVETAYANTGHLPNVHVVQGSIYNPPFKRAAEGGPFDFIYSIGVLHHLPDPAAGFHSLVTFLKPGGHIFAWVYGHENNAVVHNFINPVRKTLTSHLDPAIVSALAWPLTVALEATVGVYHLLRNTRLVRHLPSHVYLCSLSQFSFRQNHSIVFDHLVAPVAFYLKREEFEAWFQRDYLGNVGISWRNQNSWRGLGQVPVLPVAKSTPQLDVEGDWATAL